MNKTKTFDKVLIDCDILLYKNAAVGEKVSYVVKVGEEIILRAESAATIKSDVEFLGLDEGQYVREKIVEDRGLDYCKKSFKAQLNHIKNACNANSLVLYLGEDSSKNFRHTDVATIKQYKSGRSEEKPKHFSELKSWIKREYKPILSSKIESDDRLCIDSRADFNRAKKKKNKNLCKVVVATSDKDHETVPGWLYNPDKMDQPQWVSVKAARDWFWTMALIGDQIDAIQGCPGIGPAKSKKILDGCENDWQYWKAVVEAYENAYSKKLSEDGKYHYNHAYTSEECSKTPTQIAEEMCTLLHMLRHKTEVWQPPEELQNDSNS